LHFGLLVEDHFGVRVSLIGDGGIVLAAVKPDALAAGLRPALPWLRALLVGADRGQRPGGGVWLWWSWWCSAPLDAGTFGFRLMLYTVSVDG